MTGVAQIIEHCEKWLAEHPVILPRPQADEEITKAGILPFLRKGGERHYYVMLPRGDKPELGTPEWQIAKGTRMQYDGAKWMDIKPQSRHPERSEGSPSVARDSSPTAQNDGIRIASPLVCATASLLERRLAMTTEPLAITALREGIEELGLKLDNITALHDLGTLGFTSATSGNQKSMRLFAAAVTSTDDFLPQTALAPTTADRRWVTLDEFQTIGREDHVRMLGEAERQLARVA